ncbi:MAG: histone deacetylase family protein [Bdellovibrio sp.]
MKTGYITHSDCLLHDMGEHHPECPDRIRLIEDQLKADQLFDFLKYFEAPLVEESDLLRAHPKSFIDQLSSLSPREGHIHIDMDTLMNQYTLTAAKRAAGAGVLAVDQIMKGTIKNAFCNVRPPGHHAESVQAMGFCFFNNIAIAALNALDIYKLKRVAIIDFDVHHGNGTEEILMNDNRVMIFSSFQYPSYPNKSFAKDHDNIINVACPPSTGGHNYREMIAHEWFPKLKKFAPEMIFISAGFDAHHLDPLAEMNLQDSDYAWLTEQIVKIADESAKGRIVSMLEGGYHLGALAKSASAHVRALMKL